VLARVREIGVLGAGLHAARNDRQLAAELILVAAAASVAWKLSAQQLSFIVAAVLLGSVLSSLFAGAIADLIGRRWAMVLAGAVFTLSIPIIALGGGPIFLASVSATATSLHARSAT
jgi:MFS family permease